jgi:hypothetical protein
MVSPRVMDSPRSPPTESISSRATRPTKLIWLSVVCSWSSLISSSEAISSSVGVRCSSPSSLA